MRSRHTLLTAWKRTVGTGSLARTSSLHHSVSAAGAGPGAPPATAPPGATAGAGAGRAEGCGGHSRSSAAAPSSKLRMSTSLKTYL